MILSPEKASVDRITDGVWMGSRVASPDDYHRLRALGVRACVDMKLEGADPWTFDAFLWLPTPDHEAPRTAHLLLGLDFLKRCEEGQLPVYVACLAGIGRSSSLVLAHLLVGRYRDEGVEPALDYLRARRPTARPSRAQVAAAVEAAGIYCG
ncbi:MAG TPA: dual specificity protein phosphatase [Vicinamibacteria bacterium]